MFNYSRIRESFRSRFSGLQQTANLNTALARSAASFSVRNCIDNLPSSWEATGFSQNGEDGIIDFLINKLLFSRRYFAEIGSGNGTENNTSFLGHVRRYAGLQAEGDSNNHKEALLIKPWLVDCHNIFIDKQNLDHFIELLLFKDPDVFSVDIDGMDYYVVSAILEKGVRPSIFVVEYNSAYGPEKSVTIPYSSRFNMFTGPAPFLYYGASLGLWKNLFSLYGYQFLTVESNGVNAFFVCPERFENSFISSVQGFEFRENVHQFRKFRGDWECQYKILAGRELVYPE